MVTPGFIHAHCLRGSHIIWIAPQDIHVGIHDHEVIENLDRARLACGLEDAPIDVQRVRIKKAQCPVEVFVSATGEDRVEQNLVGITLVNENILARANLPAKFGNFAAMQVDQMDFAKRGSNLQRV